MKKVSISGLAATRPEGTVGVEFRPLLAENVNPPNFYLRVFDIAPGGHTPKHAHDWEHEVFIIEGKGKITLDNGDQPLEKGDAVYVEPNETHQFVNVGSAPMRMICIIPKPK